MPKRARGRASRASLGESGPAAIYLPLSNGLIGLADNLYLIRVNAFGPVAARLAYGSSSVELLIEGAPAHSKRNLTTLSLPTPADSPACRLFGDWVATPVSVASPDNTYHPGSENERAWGSLKHPNVRKIYEDYARYFYLTGELQLNNLADGRELSIRTGQEDSEVLDVTAQGDVVYRVNDQIYLARIEGNAIGIPRLVAKGDDVPEVHWLLWSPAKPSDGTQTK